MKARELADLPYAKFLEDFAGDLEEEGDYTTVRFDGNEFTGFVAGNARFIESVLSGVRFSSGRLRRTHFNDVWIHGAHIVDTDMVETTWLDAEIVNTALAGVEQFDSTMNRVTFIGCKLISVNFRSTRMTNITFANSVLRDVDFGAAELTKVTFPGSTLEDIHFSNAKLKNVDLTTAASLGIGDGYTSMAGATISLTQAVDLAPALAQSLGMKVKP
ncbi:pentapeptide repeat-containing protein [Actinocrispum sp. NPDC049592]|uniref:pentapeptide repeat-containing protein n=1 Tax=Actinocrispum sp. NPDC049592 TaxID=3154835 RepID=UPI0034399B01